MDARLAALLAAFTPLAEAFDFNRLEYAGGPEGSIVEAQLGAASDAADSLTEFAKGGNEAERSVAAFSPERISELASEPALLALARFDALQRESDEFAEIDDGEREEGREEGHWQNAGATPREEFDDLVHAAKPHLVELHRLVGVASRAGRDAG